MTQTSLHWRCFLTRWIEPPGDLRIDLPGGWVQEEGKSALGVKHTADLGVGELDDNSFISETGVPWTGYATDCTRVEAINVDILIFIISPVIVQVLSSWYMARPAETHVGHCLGSS